MGKLFREVADMGLGVYAANGAYFLVLAALPVLGLVNALPEAVAEPIRRLLGEIPTGVQFRAPVLGIAAVWSASRGVYGLLGGLRVIYGTRRAAWLGERLICLGYALGAGTLGLMMLPLTQWVAAEGMLPALAVQTAAFVGLYLTASRGKAGIWGAAVGAAGASCGCMGVGLVYRAVGKLMPHRGLYDLAGGLLALYLWAWVVLLGAVFHGKIWRN